jgi:hypothetical protein
MLINVIAVWMLTWFHYTHSSFHSFQPASVHPLPINLMLACRPSPAFQGYVCASPRSYPLLIFRPELKFMKGVCHTSPLHCASITAWRHFYCPPQALALAVHFRSFLSPVAVAGSLYRTDIFVHQ